MVARFLTVGLLALGILPNPSARQAQAHRPQTLRVSTPLSDEIAALMALATLSAQQNRRSPPNSLRFLLVSDRLSDEITEMEVMESGRQFRFAPVPARELAAVVVSVNGKLYVREIKAS